MNKPLYVCEECEGKGNYTILNAYDPDFKEVVVCEHCYGAGYVERNIKVPLVRIDTSGEVLN